MAIMKSYGLLALLKETIKIISQNIKLFSLIAFLQLVLLSLFFFINAFSTISVISDLTVNIMGITSASPGTPEFADLLVRIKEDVGTLLGVELVFVLIFFFISLFLRTSIIFVAASSYTGESLSVKELILRVAKAWTRPLVTAFYVILLNLGYIVFFFFPFLIPSLVLFNHHPLACILIIVVLVLVMAGLGLYLTVFWMLGLVVSVLEESRGLEALGKARGLIEGMKVKGVVLSVFINALLMNLSQLPQTFARFFQSPVIVLVFVLIEFVFICLVIIFENVAYTVLYVQCKKNHGEDVVMQGSSEYRQLPIEENLV